MSQYETSAPADLPARWAMEFAAGFAAECELVGASVVGGDLTSADQVVVAVTVIGSCTSPPVLRSGASAGDVLAMAGRQGWAAGGLAVLGRGFRSPRVLVEAYRRPAPPYDAGPAAAAGLLAGDVVVSLDGEAVSSMSDLIAALRLRHPGDVVVLSVHRGDHVVVVQLTLAERAGD